MPDEDDLRKILAERDAASAMAEADAKATKEAEAQRNHQFAIYGGVALLVVALVVGSIWYSKQDGEEDGGDTGAGNLACTLAMGGVGVLVAGFTHNKTPSVIFAEVAVPAIGGYACQQAIDTMARSPSEPVNITVTHSNQTVTRTVTLNDLIAPPAPPTTTPQQVPNSAALERALYCWRTYPASSFANDLCVAGIG